MQIWDRVSHFIEKSQDVLFMHTHTKPTKSKVTEEVKQFPPQNEIMQLQPELLI